MLSLERELRLEVQGQFIEATVLCRRGCLPLAALLGFGRVRHDAWLSALALRLFSSAGSIDIYNDVRYVNFL